MVGNWGIGKVGFDYPVIVGRLRRGMVELLY